MVGGLQSHCVLPNLTQIMVMPRGMAASFPRRGQGRKFVLGGGSDSGLLVVLLGGCGNASLNTRAESR